MWWWVLACFWSGPEDPPEVAVSREGIEEEAVDQKTSSW